RSELVRSAAVADRGAADDVEAAATSIVMRQRMATDADLRIRHRHPPRVPCVPDGFGAVLESVDIRAETCDFFGCRTELAVSTAAIGGFTPFEVEALEICRHRGSRCNGRAPGTARGPARHGHYSTAPL